MRMRSKNLISWPKLNDKGGDLSKSWYVEYSYRVGDKVYRRRESNGLCKGTRKERLAAANLLIKKYTQILESGAYLTDVNAFEPVREQDMFKPEAQRFHEHEKSLKMRNITTKYMDSIKASLKPSSIRTYQGELNIFIDWVETKLDDKSSVDITREDLLPFFDHLVLSKEEGGRGLCHKTVSKYLQRLTEFYEWMNERGYCDHQPVTNIKNRGKHVDCAPAPFEQDERTRLKNAIATRDPWLWLACELIYQCAIRPGEIRLIQIKDIQLDRKVICIRSEVAKNKKTQEVGLPENIIEQMQNLGVFSYGQELYLFGSRWVPNLKPIGTTTLRQRFLVYKRELKISDDRKLYSWKHTGAIVAVDNGMDVMELKDHMRHESVATTMQYMKKRTRRVHVAEKFIAAI